MSKREDRLQPVNQPGRVRVKFGKYANEMTLHVVKALPKKRVLVEDRAGNKVSVPKTWLSADTRHLTIKDPGPVNSMFNDLAKDTRKFNGVFAPAVNVLQYPATLIEPPTATMVAVNTPNTQADIIMRRDDGHPAAAGDARWFIMSTTLDPSLPVRPFTWKMITAFKVRVIQ